MCNLRFASCCGLFSYKNVYFTRLISVAVTHKDYHSYYDWSSCQLVLLYTLKSNTFISNAPLKLARNQENAKQYPGGWTFAIWKSFTFFITSSSGTFYRCSEIIRDTNFTIFTVYATVFAEFTAFQLSNYLEEIDHFILGLLKTSDAQHSTFWKISNCEPGERRVQ